MNEKSNKGKSTKKGSNLISNIQPLISKDYRGITLVALIITIIVMLILVGVSITIAINGGLFDTTKRAAKQTEKAKNAEQELSSGRIKIDGIWYDSFEDYVNGKESDIQGVEDLTESNTSFIYNQTNWTNEEVKVKISTTALTTGYTLQYSTDGLNWLDYTAGTEVPVGRDGEIFARLIDSEGNEGGSISGKAVNVDKNGPTINTHLNSTGAVGNTIPLSINVTDGNSGISKIEWYYKESTASTYEKVENEYMVMNGATAGEKGAVTKETTLTGLTELTTYNIYAVIYDVAGNSTRSPEGTGTIDIQTQEPPVMPEVGDYVKYEPDTVSTPYTLEGKYSGYGNYSTYSLPYTMVSAIDQSIPQEKLEWQILKIYEDGSIKLIGSPTNTDVYFGGALGYNNGVYLLHDICKEVYSKNLPDGRKIEARSVSLEDFEDESNDGNWKSIRDAYVNGALQYDKTKTFTDANYRYYPNLYAQENGSGINTNTVKTNGIQATDKGYSTLTEETYSKASSKLTVTQKAQSIGIDETTYGKSAKALALKDISKSYWLATRCVRVWNDTNAFELYYVSGMRLDCGTSIFQGNGYARTWSAKLRPVVILDSNIELNLSLEGTDGEPNTFEITKY